MNSLGSGLVYSTYLGGTSDDRSHGIALDATGRANVTGATRSADFPTTAGAFDTTYNGGIFDAFVTKFDGTGAALGYSTYLGGTGSFGEGDQGFGIAVDAGGRVYVTGRTASGDFPTTAGAFDSTFNSLLDAFVTTLDLGGDLDGDGVLDGVDNCPLTPNTDQANNDGDALGDACDPDDDNDGVLDGPDNCPLVANSDQTDTDGDGQGDACDSDDDNDGVPDTTDNCPLTANPDQANNDGDALGDACDPDDDNDGVPDTTDNCQFTPNPEQEDADFDGIGDACDPVFNSSDECKVTGGGTITADKHNFGINAQVKGGVAKGNVHYQDKVADKHLQGANVTGVACRGVEFSIVGTGTVGGAAVNFLVTGEDNGEPGANDIFRIKWSGGDTYANGGTLSGGNVQLDN